MADNVGYTPGTGATIAADDIGGILYQRVKIGVGVDGSATDVSSTNPMPVSGTFWQTTQPVSATSLPLPSGAATAAKQPALGTAGAASTDVLSVQGIASMTPLKVDGSATTQPVSGTFWQATQPVSIATMPSTPVTGTFWQTTQPVSATSLPLPSGAATAAKQPALGTAGTPSADVLTVQGATSMTALKVDGSAVTQPISGTVTANAGTNLNTSALALESGGNLATLVTRTPAVGQTTMSGSSPVVIASDQSALSVNYAAAATQTYNVAGVITINTVLLTLDLAQYRGASIQCTSMGTTGVVTPEWSNDNATWIAATIFTPPGASATTFSAAGLWNVQKQARYLRLRLSTATTAGTTTIYTEAYQTMPQAWFATQPVSGTFWQATQPVSMATNTPTLAAGTNLAADVGVQYRASATGGATIKHVIAAAGTNATSVKASAGRVIGWSFSNTTAAYKYVRLYNLTTAPTVGTSTVIQTIGIPPNGIAQLQFPGGIGYATGIALSITGAAADNDTTAVVANDVVGDLFYA